MSATVSDLLMPKLGLTMTEGTVARWLLASGARFAAGTPVVVIETDKIANEVEAPAAGALLDLLASEGEVVPVGTPIARWQLDEDLEGTAARPSQGEPHVTTPPEPVSSPATPPAADHSPGRIVATPYARRLARETALDLSTIAGSGPRGRIKAADVQKARASATPPQTAHPVRAVPHADAIAAPSTAHAFLTADVDVSALRALDARLASPHERPFERRAYVALACMKAIAPDGERPVRLGFATNGALAMIEGTARNALSAVVAHMAHLRTDGTGGDLAIYIVDGRIRQMVPALPRGWRLALGIGGVRTIDSAATYRMTLALVYDNATDHTFAAALLDRIAALLEEPLHLLAG